MPPPSEETVSRLCRVLLAAGIYRTYVPVTRICIMISLTSGVKSSHPGFRPDKISSGEIIGPCPM